MPEVWAPKGDYRLFVLDILRPTVTLEAGGRTRALSGAIPGSEPGEGTCTRCQSMPYTLFNIDVALSPRGYNWEMPRTKRRSRPCLICGTDDPSREHVIAQWLRKELQLRGLVSEYRMDVGYKENVTPLRKWDTLAIVLPDVCKGCNNGWMRDLELAVQPILKPMLLGASSRLPTYLDAESQTRLAAWALKTSMLLVAKLYKNQPAGWLPMDSLRWLKDHRGLSPLPPGAKVWLACLDAQREVAAFIKSGTIITDAGESIAHIGTFSVGYAIFQVFCRELDNGKIPPWRDAGFTPKGQFRRAMLDIWPTKDVVAWPPPVHFKKESIFELAQRFNSEFIKSDATVRIIESRWPPHEF